MPIQPTPSLCCSHPASAQQSHGRSCLKSTAFGVRRICHFRQQYRKPSNLCPGIACFRMQKHTHGYFQREVLLRFGTSPLCSMSIGTKTKSAKPQSNFQCIFLMAHLILTTGPKEVISAAFPSRVQRIVCVVRIEHYCWLSDRSR